MLNIRLRKLFAFSVLAVGLVSSAYMSHREMLLIEADAIKRFNAVCDQISLKIEERLGAYALILRGGKALFAASVNVDREEWKDYVDNLSASGTVQGIQGIGYAVLIQPDELAAHERRVRAEGFPGYAVKPPGQRDLYSSIVFLEPFDPRNQRAFGYDMYSEPVRRQAMEAACDSGEPVLSGKVQLLQENGQDVQPGTLMYVPVYKNDRPITTLEERRQAIIGWTYSPYRMNNLLMGILGDAAQADMPINLEVYDSAISAENLLYDSMPQRNADPQELLYTLQTMKIYGREWRLVFTGAAKEVINYGPAWIILAGGILVSGLIFWAILLLQMRSAALVTTRQLTEELRLREALLKESEFRWKYAIEGSGDGLWDMDVAQSTLFYSDAFQRLLGFSHHDMGNHLDDWLQRVHPDDIDALRAVIDSVREGRQSNFENEHRVLTQSGSYEWMLCRATSVNYDEEGHVKRIIGMLSLITHRKELEAQIRELAFYDPLTGLANRRLLDDRLAQLLLQLQRSGHYAAIMVFDLDRFKALNDAHGHAAGDKLLRDVARRIQHGVRASDTVARFGGDEFVILLSDLGADEDQARSSAHKIAEDIRIKLSEAYAIHVTEQDHHAHALRYQCVASIGVAVFKAPVNRKHVFSTADKMMYQAKACGGNQVRMAAAVEN